MERLLLYTDFSDIIFLFVILTMFSNLQSIVKCLRKDE